MNDPNPQPLNDPNPNPLYDPNPNPLYDPNSQLKINTKSKNPEPEQSNIQTISSQT